MLCKFQNQIKKSCLIKRFSKLKVKMMLKHFFQHKVRKRYQKEGNRTGFPSWGTDWRRGKEF